MNLNKLKKYLIKYIKQRKIMNKANNFYKWNYKIVLKNNSLKVFKMKNIKKLKQKKYKILNIIQ